MASNSKALYGGSTDLGDRRVTCYRGKNIVIEFQMHRRQIAKIAVGKDLRRAVHSVTTDRAMPYAISISPFDPKGKAPHYRDSFRVREGYQTIAGMRRVCSRLWNISDHSVEVEWINQSKVLTRTLRFLNHESVLAHLTEVADRVASQQPFNPDVHPRGKGGRFIRRTR